METLNFGSASFIKSLCDSLLSLNFLMPALLSVLVSLGIKIAYSHFSFVLAMVKITMIFTSQDF